jgi:chemotaxis protein methyltransferase CheR
MPALKLAGLVNSRVVQRCLRTYSVQLQRIWKHVPAPWRLLPGGQLLGTHVHVLARLTADRKQYFGTFFLRNRPEMELLKQLIINKPVNSVLKLTVLACSKGAEVYSILWTIRSIRPDLRIRTYAVDISQEILGFAENGVYSRPRSERRLLDSAATTCKAGVARNTDLDQNASIFERLNTEEVEAMFEVQTDQLKVRSCLKEGITWLRGDAGDPEFIRSLGPQEVVFANRFLCHMEPLAAENCLRNLAQLVELDGYLFVSGVDLDVREKVAREMGWKPITDMLGEIHEGDVSLRGGWPLEYWGLEPFCDKRSDWKTRYASVFQICTGSRHVF